MRPLKVNLADSFGFEVQTVYEVTKHYLVNGCNSVSVAYRVVLFSANW
jgi:hypothetical protein